MNQLLESRRILESKIAHKNELIAKKEVEIKRAEETLSFLTDSKIKLQQELWQDEFALEAVNEEINKIPTVALHKQNDYLKSLVTAVAFLLLTSYAFAQPFVSMEAGNRMGINAGMIFKNVEVKGGALIPYTRRSDISNVTYAGAGYRIGNEFNVTPLIGIAHYHNIIKGVDEVSKTNLLASLEIGKDFTTVSDHFGNYYLFISHANEMYYGAGLKIYVK